MSQVSRTSEVINLRTSLHEFDDLISVDGIIGTIKLAWQFILSGFANPLPSESGHPGILRIDTSAVINANSIFALQALSASVFYGELFNLLFCARLNTLANCIARIGIFDTGAVPPVNGAYFEKLAADVNWFRVIRSANVDRVRADTGVAINTDFNTFRVQRVSATGIGFSINNGVQAIEAPAIQPSGAIPAGFEIQTTIAAIRSIDCDFLEMHITGLNR